VFLGVISALVGSASCIMYEGWRVPHLPVSPCDDTRRGNQELDGFRRERSMMSKVGSSLLLRTLDWRGPGS
jgi:hypothetical protein